MTEIINFPQDDKEAIFRDWLKEESMAVGRALEEDFDYTITECTRSKLVVYYHLNNSDAAEVLEITGTPIKH